MRLSGRGISVKVLVGSLACLVLAGCASNQGAAPILFEHPLPGESVVTNQDPMALPLPGAPGATNPAVTQADIATTICTPGWSASVRPPSTYTEPIKRHLMAEAGISKSAASTLELDHRVPIEVGGDPSDLRQFWLEPWSGPYGARAKDHLENRVHADVCMHRLTLQQGQAIFLTNYWQASVP